MNEGNSTSMGQAAFLAPLPLTWMTAAPSYVVLMSATLA
jgi:hypothetical protein